MRRLEDPPFSGEETLEKCIEGIGRQTYKNRIVEDVQSFIAFEQQYREHASNEELYTLPALHQVRDDDPVVFNDFKKSELVRLYEYYLRNTEKPGREIYEALMLHADEQCPFCGGIGRPRNLDHYLPKAHFPQFSIIPLNLIPACQECNMGAKGAAYATSASEQVLHPYLDRDIFFNEQWITATYIDGDPGIVQYYFQPPDSWAQADKDRAEKHWQDFDIAKRYSIEAGKHLSEVIPQRDISLPLIGEENFKICYLQPVIATAAFPNHWKRVMYQALIESDCFF
jgi:hypothetical protein